MTKCLIIGIAIAVAVPAAAQNPDDLIPITQVLASQPDLTDNDRMYYLATRCAALNFYVGILLEGAGEEDNARLTVGEVFFRVAKQIDLDVQAARGVPWTDERASQSVMGRIMTMQGYYIARAKRNRALTGNTWGGEPVFEADFTACDAALETMLSEK